MCTVQYTFYCLLFLLIFLSFFHAIIIFYFFSYVSFILLFLHHPQRQRWRSLHRIPFSILLHSLKIFTVAAATSINDRSRVIALLLALISVSKNSFRLFSFLVFFLAHMLVWAMLLSSSSSLLSCCCLRCSTHSAGLSLCFWFYFNKSKETYWNSYSDSIQTHTHTQQEILCDEYTIIWYYYYCFNCMLCTRMWAYRTMYSMLYTIYFLSSMDLACVVLLVCLSVSTYFCIVCGVWCLRSCMCLSACLYRVFYSLSLLPTSFIVCVLVFSRHTMWCVWYIRSLACSLTLVPSIFHSTTQWAQN